MPFFLSMDNSQLEPGSIFIADKENEFLLHEILLPVIGHL